MIYFHCSVVITRRVSVAGSLQGEGPAAAVDEENGWEPKIIVIHKVSLVFKGNKSESTRWPQSKNSLLM